VTEPEVCNAALHKPAYMSRKRKTAEGDSYAAFLANDGSRTNSIVAGSCAISLQENTWWVVDLGIPMTVKFVHLTTSQPCKFMRQ